jgi:hypothetical protein
VLAIDEKPSIQALERAQGCLKLPSGRAMTGQSHDYTRHGTTTLFAALDLSSGKVVGRHYKRRILCKRRPTHRPYRRLHRQLQRDCHTLRLDKKQGSSKTPRTMSR